MKVRFASQIVKTRRWVAAFFSAHLGQHKRSAFIRNLPCNLAPSKFYMRSVNASNNRPYELRTFLANFFLAGYGTGQLVVHFPPINMLICRGVIYLLSTSFRAVWQPRMSSLAVGCFSLSYWRMKFLREWRSWYFQPKKAFPNNAKMYSDDRKVSSTILRWCRSPFSYIFPEQLLILRVYSFREWLCLASFAPQNIHLMGINSYQPKVFGVKFSLKEIESIFFH